MSQDYIVFDPTDLETPAKEDLIEWINSLVGDGKEDSFDQATKSIVEIVAWAGEKFGAGVNEGSNWTSWPPTLLAGGRHCTFNLDFGADAMTFMMLLSDQCKRLKLVMIDPSGREPFMTIPSGGGLLD
ncbi:MAG: hypothetical protein HKN25_16785 [Pyrinomonadaceae bacterium]|nr:hypothetical protein [Pyrinomonadaceae bacterium]